jgi:hypothetical protein
MKLNQTFASQEQQDAQGHEPWRHHLITTSLGYSPGQLPTGPKNSILEVPGTFYLTQANQSKRTTRSPKEAASAMAA